MKFEEYISKCENSLGVVNEQGYQATNNIQDFFKNLGTILKGGGDPKEIKISLKDKQKLDELAKTLNPPYDQAKNGSKDLVTNNKINESLISSNIYEIMYDLAMRNSPLSTDVYNILSQTPKVVTNTSGGQNKGRTTVENIQSQLQKAGISLSQVESTVKKVLEKPLKSGIVKWEAPRELSPKDLFNRAVNKLTQTVGQTGKELLSGEVTAGGRM
jgi:hypothetical protein